MPPESWWGVRVLETFESDFGEQPARLGLESGLGESTDFHRQHHVVDHRTPLQQVVLLEYDGPILVRTVELLPVDDNSSRRGLEDARNQQQERALSAAAGPDDGKELPFLLG